MRKGFLSRSICVLLLFTLIMTVLSGCRKEDSDVAEGDSFSVVTSFYPMYVFTKNIVEGAENVTVENMTEADAGCLHDYQLLPRDLKLLEKADLFVTNGADMENFLDKVTESIETLKIISASDGIELLENHEHLNPHVWMYIPNAVIQIENITESLCSLNPENENIYKQNCKSYTEKLMELDKKFSQAALKISNKNIIVTHGTFDYMARGYGFNIVGSVLNEHNTEPSAAELSKLADAAKKENAAAVFMEPQYSENSVNVLSKEANIPVYTLDPMVTGKDGEYLGVFEKIIEENIRILETALK